ncbi:hypothetical protein BAUCODRAFT_77441, partial [Baudoinia panamericana UAMH 10762]
MLDLAAHWLDECQSGHEECRRYPAPSWYPTRLLRLEGGKAHLIRTADEKPSGPYATLSHCWGRKEFLILTRVTETVFTSGRPISDFPATHREAMQAAQRLGFSLIWIDCYCIVQITTPDKLHEISRMQDVYANTTLNIGATSAENAYSGCF